MAGYQRTSQPAVEPVTLDEVKAQAVITAGNTDDALLTRLIKVARQEAENLTHRTLIASGWLRTLDAFPAAVHLIRGPVISVDSILYDDEDGIEQTLNPADFVLDKSDGMRCYVVPAYGKAWPSTRAHINAVRVAYTAGFGAAAADVPEDLRHWIMVRVATLYEHREQFVTGTIVSPAPYMQTLLEPYVMPVV